MPVNVTMPPIPGPRDRGEAAIERQRLVGQHDVRAIAPPATGGISASSSPSASTCVVVG